MQKDERISYDYVPKDIAEMGSCRPVRVHLSWTRLDGLVPEFGEDYVIIHTNFESGTG